MSALGVSGRGLLRCKCLLLTLSGHALTLLRCLLLRVERTCADHPAMSLFDPERALVVLICRSNCRVDSLGADMRLALTVPPY